MAYHLLTGATGLLGTYLLRDLFASGIRVAVLVRSNKLEVARQRIEAIMTRWDRVEGRSLPRPVILEGDLSNERFNLDEQSLHWVSENCDSIIQNAASVSYYGKRPHEDPWRTNIGGTQNALEFCRLTGIRQYHHVSTAYVCGKREGRVYENELDEGQELNTDYEKSKFEGEQVVRAARHIDPPTIYRAAIIIGDSRTGHTPTFHGFYVPLKLVHTMYKHVIQDDLQVGPLLEAIQIQGHERKNLVPVDWISRVMAHIILNPQHHGDTYHLAPEHPVTTNVMRDSMVQAFATYGDPSARTDHNEKNGWTFNPGEFVKYFRDQMSIYESYWKDDPIFDLTNTKRVAPHLPPPEIDQEMLLRLCKYAIESNFGWPRPAPVELEIDVNKILNQMFPSQDTPPSAQAVGLQVNGAGGGQWELVLDGNHAISIRPGISPQCRHRFYLNSHTYKCLENGELSVRETLESAQTIFEGEELPQSNLIEVLEQVICPGTNSVKTRE